MDMGQERTKGKFPADSHRMALNEMHSCNSAILSFCEQANSGF